MVSVVAALSKRKENLAFDLNDEHCRDYPSFKTHLEETFKYANVGVRVSAGIVAQTGTRFGGLGAL